MTGIQEGMTAAQVSEVLMNNFSEVSAEADRAKTMAAAEETRAKGVEQGLTEAVAQNAGEIIALKGNSATKAELDAEAERAQAAEQTLAQAVSSVAGRVTAIEGGYATDVELFEESERAKAAEGEIRGSVESLSEDFNAASEDIGKLETALEAEKGRAKAAEQALSVEITEAENRVDERVTEVRDSLEEEVQARTAAVAVMGEKLTELGSIIGSTNTEEKQGYLSSGGYIETSATNYHCLVTDKVPTKKGDVFFYKGMGRSLAYSCIIYKGNEIVETIQVESENKFVPLYITKDADSVVFSSYNSIGNSVVLEVYKKSILSDKIDEIENQSNLNKVQISKIEADIHIIKSTKEIEPNTWYNIFENVSISKGERFRVKIASNNQLNRIILGSNENRVLDIQDSQQLMSNEWIERTSGATSTDISIYISTENGLSANVTIEIQKGISLLPNDVEDLKKDIDKLNSEYNGYSKEDVVNSGSWWIYYPNLKIAKGEFFRFRINTQSEFTRIIIGSSDKRLFDSDTKGLPDNNQWEYVTSAYDIDFVNLFIVFANAQSDKVSLEVQKGDFALSGQIDNINTELGKINDNIKYLPNTEEKVAYNLGEERISAETSTQNGRLLTNLHIKKGEIFKVKVNASSSDWSRVFIYFNEDVAYSNRLWDSDGGNDRTNKWASYEAKADIYSLGLYAVSSGAVFSLELEKQGFLERAVTSDVLWGKKWAVCGDSFTDGATYTLIQDGKYVGKKYVYPYIIGNRTNIEVLKFFSGGRTLAYPQSGEFENSLTAPTQEFYFKNIPEDVDYITIYLGINDSHHNYGSSGSDGEDVTGHIPLGTIEDNTTASYYGAWNVVLSWLLENRPFAHIGIIVSNGCDWDSYRIAQIEIAKKYGIPYIDLNGDERTPAMIRSTNPNIAASVKESRLRTQSVSETNSHPNDVAHLFESTFIENFLRSL